MEKRQIKDVLKFVRKAQIDIKVAEARLLALLGEESEMEIPEWAVDRVNLWKDLYAKGGTVDKRELYKIAKKHGFDNRGLGGFFVGKNKSLMKLADGRIALTESATNKMKDWDVIKEE